jgi:ankyrin repeat protein
MSHKILDAIINCHYSQLVIYARHNYNFKVKSLDDGYNALMVALQIGDKKKRYRMFEFLIKQDLIDLCDTDKQGRDIYFHAVIKECERELDLLMKYFNLEVDCTRVDSSGKTILHYAVINNNLKVLETLVNYCAKYKINVDIPDKINKIT